jgi:hypothetical protein
MIRLNLALLVAALATDSVFSCCGVSRVVFGNFRSGDDYSTATKSMTELTLVRSQFYISPQDSFDFLPSASYNSNVIDSVKEELAAGTAEQRETNAVVEGSDKDLEDWAQAFFGDTEMEKYTSPRPNESLTGKVLTIENTKEILERKPDGELTVLCHKMEEGTSFCHKLHQGFSITAVAVSTNGGKPSDVWVACHWDETKMCHAINVGDMVFVEKQTPMLRAGI